MKLFKLFEDVEIGFIVGLLLFEEPPLGKDGAHQVQLVDERLELADIGQVDLDQLVLLLQASLRIVDLNSHSHAVW